MVVAAFLAAVLPTVEAEVPGMIHQALLVYTCEALSK